MTETHTYSGVRLDAEISQLMDDLESRTIRNNTCRFLEFHGFIGPQLALDEPIHVDREGLLMYLIGQEANSLDKLGELTQAFTKSPQKRLPYIDLPAAVPIDLHIERKLDLYPYGREWLQEVMKRKGKNGERLSERRVRENLFDFMKREGIPSIDTLIAKAKKIHCNVETYGTAGDGDTEPVTVGGYVH